MTDIHPEVASAKVCLISVTPDAEKHMGYVARVSNPNNQDNPKVAKLLGYCIKHGHWSVFEQAFMTLEINTTRGIATKSCAIGPSHTKKAPSMLTQSPTPQILSDLRSQDSKNRQNSIDDVEAEKKAFLQGRIHQYFIEGMDLYNELLREGIAKECARFVLPLATPTKIYMTGSVRSWIHYITLRSANGTQLEHMEIAKLCKQHFVCQFPQIAEALEWKCDNDCECHKDCLDQPSILIE